MRLCRYRYHGQLAVGFYDEQGITPLRSAAALPANKRPGDLELTDSVDLLDYLPPDGKGFAIAKRIGEWLAKSRPAGGNVSLEPGDIISTGTPQGVGNAKGSYLKSGDRIEASIETIGTLINEVS